MCFNEKFGLFMRGCREEKKLSRERLAEICDISDRCISNIERGVSEPKMITAVKLWKALEIDPDKLAEVLQDIDVHILL